MYIPWRIILELQMSAEQAIEKIAYVTRPKKSVWYLLGFASADWSNKFDRVLFDGIVNKSRNTFHLTTTSGRGSIVLQGAAKNQITGTVVRVWVLPPAYMIVFALSFAFFLLVQVIRHPKPQQDPYAILKLAAFMLAMFGVIFWLIRLKAQSVLKNLFAGKIAKPISEQLPWPELPELFAHRPTSTDDEPEMIPTPDPTLVEHFESLSCEILTHRSTPPRVLKVDSGKQHLSLQFPPRSSDGFEVSVEADNAGATIFAEGKEVVAFTIQRDSGDTFDIVTDTFRVVRELLSPKIQLRVFSINGMVVKLKREHIDESGKTHSYLVWKLKGKTPSGIKTERVLINRHMPRPN